MLQKYPYHNPSIFPSLSLISPSYMSIRCPNMFLTYPQKVPNMSQNVPYIPLASTFKSYDIIKTIDTINSFGTLDILDTPYAWLFLA